MPELSQGDLQTLIATLQNTNVQLGNIIRALAGSVNLSNQTKAQMQAFANDAAAAAGGVPLWGLYLNSTTYALTARHV